MNMYRLQLQFKGDRNYLHGSDFYNSINVLCKSLYLDSTFVSKIIFRSFAQNQCEVLFKQPVENINIMATGVIKDLNDGDFGKPFWVVECDEPVLGRYSFEEDELVKYSNLAIEDKEIKLNSSVDFSIVEEVIAITKKINYAINPDINGKWVFGQLDLKQPFPEGYDEVSVKMTKILANRFSVNEIKVDNEVVGNIRFIVGTP